MLLKKKFSLSGFVYFIIMALGTFEGISQHIQSVEVHLESEPITISVSVQSLAGYQGRIEKSSLGDESNTQVVEMYYEHCIPFL